MRDREFIEGVSCKIRYCSATSPCENKVLIRISNRRELRAGSTRNGNEGSCYPKILGGQFLIKRTYGKELCVFRQNQRSFLFLSFPVAGLEGRGLGNGTSLLGQRMSR